MVWDPEGDKRPTEIPLGARVEYRVPGLERTGIFGEVFGEWFTGALLLYFVPPCYYKVKWDDGRVDEHVRPWELAHVTEEK